MPEEFPNMPERMHFISDRRGNNLQVGAEISAEDALKKITEGYDVQIVTYVKQAPRVVMSEQK